MMRVEEIWAAEAVSEILSADSTCPGEDPPDFYAVINGRRVAFEVTRLAWNCIDDSGEVVNFLELSPPVTRYVQQLDEQLSESLPDGVIINVHTSVPISDFRHFKAQLKETILEFIRVDQLELETAWFSLNKRKARQRGKGIIGFVASKKPVRSLIGQLIVSLRKSMSEKQKKLAGQNGPLGLVLIVEHHLFDNNVIAQIDSHQLPEFEDFCLVALLSAKHGLVILKNEI